MKRLSIYLWFALLLPIGGCSGPALSVHPLVREEEAVFEPGLVGIWCEESEELVCDEDALWTFEEDGERTYKLTIQDLKDEQEKFVFKVRLARLDGWFFLDAVLSEQIVRGRKVDTDFLLPVHMLGRIEVEPDAVRIRMLESDWVRNSLKSGDLELTHEKLQNGEVLITAKPEELQEFARRYGWIEEAFSLKFDLIRKTTVK